MGAAEPRGTDRAPSRGGAAGAPLRLNLGCGSTCPDGWENIDNSPGVVLAKVPRLGRLLRALVPSGVRLLPSASWSANTTWMDLTRRLPYADGSVACAYASHFFEHLTWEETARLLAECHRVLAPGGVVRVVVPDFAAIVDGYLADRANAPADAARRFHANTCFFEEPVPRSVLGLLLFQVRSKNNHRFLYDEAALRRQLEAAGFVSVERKACGDSAIDGISALDHPDRFANAICLEGVKPGPAAEQARPHG